MQWTQYDDTDESQGRNKSYFIWHFLGTLLTQNSCKIIIIFIIDLFFLAVSFPENNPVSCFLKI